MNSIQPRLQDLKWISQGFFEDDIQVILAATTTVALKKGIKDITNEGLYTKLH